MKSAQGSSNVPQGTIPSVKQTRETKVNLADKAAGMELLKSLYGKNSRYGNNDHFGRKEDSSTQERPNE